MPQVQRYLEALLGKPVRVLGLSRLGETADGASIKGYGYGVPVRVRFETRGRPRSAVLETMRANRFGHEHMSDRAQVLLWQHDAFNRLPRHARSLDAGAFDADGTLVSLGRIREPFILMEFIEGRPYAEDLERLRDTRELREPDVARADALCDYLAQIHRVPGSEPSLYVRRVRELLGHGECIMGLADSYPAQGGPVSASRLEAIEQRCVAWRWRLKQRVHRLRQVHGDLHPWNILFREGTDFSVLDRSRGEWGEPADDVACLSMNYLFFSLQRSGRLDGNLAMLFRRFWDRYLEKTGDREMLEVVAPFFAFRGLVMASPIWYPTLPEAVRRALLAFIERVLEADAFDPARANDYCEA